MAVQIALGGKSGGDGFLIASSVSDYPAELSLSETSGTLAVTLQASPNPAGLVFLPSSLTLTAMPTIVQVHALQQSGAREDTTIRVLDSAMNEVGSFTVTAIKKPKVNFKGRFEVRFATDNSAYNNNPMYTDTIDTVVPPGWTWALEGEPEFVPPINIPENLETPVGRVLRFNNPVALRSHAQPVVSTVVSVSGQVIGGGIQTFTAGDPIIGQEVNVGPNTYLASNWPISGAAPEEFVDTTNFPPTERMALFEFHIGTMFSGASQIGPFVAKATTSGQQTRTPDSRPKAAGIVNGTNDRINYPLDDLLTWSENRIAALVIDHDNTMPPPTPPEKRNLARRIGHLFHCLTLLGSSTPTNIINSHPPGTFISRRTTLLGGWDGKEVYTGMVDANLAFNIAGSMVATFLADFPSFLFECHMFAFHSDELCGHHTGSLSAHAVVNGGYVGDPHTHTVDGTNYDFQAVGEFTLLRDGSQLEIQVRQAPVATQNPITDGYTGLTSCVSINTAVAARLGKHRVSLQPGGEGRRLQFYVDGTPAELSKEGIDLGGNRVAAFDANGETGMRVDFEDGTVLLVTPAFWNAHDVWYLNVNVSNTTADEGIMGRIPRNSWLPRLRDGQSVGPKPASLQDRYAVLYKKFADSWRVTSQTSLFVYDPGKSTKEFTDRDWPAGKPPCKMKPEFQVPGVPVFKGMPLERAHHICKAVTDKDLHRNCVFDVATTGDEVFAKGYLFQQELRRKATRVQVTVAESGLAQQREPDDRRDREPRRPSLFLTATVASLHREEKPPAGTVTFYVDGEPVSKAVKLDDQGTAHFITGELPPGDHQVSATFEAAGRGREQYQSGASRMHVHKLENRRR